MAKKDGAGRFGPRLERLRIDVDDGRQAVAPHRRRGGCEQRRRPASRKRAEQVVFASNCARWRPRSRRSGAGPSSRAAGPSRAPRGARRAPAAGRPGQVRRRRVQQDGEKAGSRAPRVGRARARGSRRRRAAAAYANGVASGWNVWTMTRAGRVAAAPARQLRHELERPLLGAEVREREAGIGIDDGGDRDAGEVVPLRDHLRPDRAPRRARPRSARAPRGALRAWRRCRRRAGCARGRGRARASSASSRCVPAPMRASSTEPQSGQCSGSAVRVPAVVAVQTLVARAA